MTTLNLFQVLAHLAVARQNCVKINNAEWYTKHRNRAHELVREHLHFERVEFDIDESGDSRLVFSIDFSYVDGSQTTHQVIVTPSLCDLFALRITGSNRKDCKELIHDAFTNALKKAETL